MKRRIALWAAVVVASVIIAAILINGSPKNPSAAMEAYTLLLAAFTGVLCAATVELWLASRRQLEDARLNNRAYVSVEPGGLAPWRGTSDQFLGHVRITNAGILPARRLTWLLQIEMSANGDRQDFKIPTERRGNQLVVGRSSMARGSPPILQKPDAYCFVWGVAEYDDGYGGRRFTKFCHRYNCKTDSFTRDRVVSEADARQHEFGNEAD